MVKFQILIDYYYEYQGNQKQLNHIKALKALEKFKDENIKIVLPLSYSGDKQYLEEIYKYLECVFKGKYIVLKDFIPKEEYFKILENFKIFNLYAHMNGVDEPLRSEFRSELKKQISIKLEFVKKKYIYI